MPLETVDPALHGVALAVVDRVEAGWPAAPGAELLAVACLVGLVGNRAADPAATQVGAVLAGGVRLVRPHTIRAYPRAARPDPGHADLCQYGFELRRVPTLPCRHDDRHGLLALLDGQVQLGGEPAARPSQSVIAKLAEDAARWFLLQVAPLAGPGSMLMGAADRGIDAQVPRDRTLRIGQGLEQGEDPMRSPRDAGKLTTGQVGLMRGAQTMPAPRKYPLELRERAVRMYRTAEPKPVIRRMAEELGVHHEALRNWIRQAEADAGERDDLLTTEEKNELAQLRREVRGPAPGERGPADGLGSFRRAARPDPAQVTALLDEHPHLGVEPVLRELRIPSSTYYRWRQAEKDPCERIRLDCTDKTVRYNSTDPKIPGSFLRIACDKYSGGASGGPFLVKRGGWGIIGVIGGWKTGGDKDDISYSSYLDSDAKALYDDAVNNRQPAGRGVLGKAETWQHAEVMAGGYFTDGNPGTWDYSDLVVRWSDGEVTLYRGAGEDADNFDKEIRLIGPNGTWKHAATMAAGDFTGADRDDLIVRWTDGELTLYPDVDEKGFHGEVQLQKPNALWQQADSSSPVRSAFDALP